MRETRNDTAEREPASDRDFLQAFLRVVRAAGAHFETLSPEEARRPLPKARSSGGWSIQQVVGHLVDSALHNHWRLVEAQLREDLCFPGYDQDAWERVQDWQSADWKGLVSHWDGLQGHLVHVAERVQAEAWNRPRHPHTLDRIAWEVVPADESVTLAYLARDYVAHHYHHLRQIDPGLAPEPILQRSGTLRGS